MNNSTYNVVNFTVHIKLQFSTTDISLAYIFKVGKLINRFSHQHCCSLFYSIQDDFIQGFCETNCTVTDNDSLQQCQHLCSDDFYSVVNLTCTPNPCVSKCSLHLAHHHSLVSVLQYG